MDDHETIRSLGITAAVFLAITIALVFIANIVG